MSKMSDDELENIRKRKLLSMQNRVSDEQRQAQAEEKIEAQKQALLRQILSPEARQRLNNLKMVKAEFTEQIELQLIQMAQMGKLPIPLSDTQLKQILLQLQSRKRETKITRI
ncbi:MAG: DNA-binding protein [Candidatus Bathyarchaeota archaeon]|nr:DNA-binding protein [Candidatus Termiticorpusculum sp.]MCL2868748.1 DNA-binding protein [Candidatus Termiticorpusculum sp.]